MMCAASVSSDLRNRSRAGTGWKRLATSMRVPGAMPCSRRCTSLPALTRISQPTSLSRARVRRVKRETLAMDGRASPRKPKLRICPRSAASRILLVAWRRRASSAWSGSIPIPSSSTTSNAFPPREKSTVTRRAPASRAFSRSSLAAAAGRSTTSPAAIWLATLSSRMRMTGRDIGAGRAP